MKKPTYPIGFPAWKTLARMGVRIAIPLDVIHDQEAKVYVITSSKLRGLVVEMPESASTEEVHRELQFCVNSLMREILHRAPRTQPVTIWPGEFQAA